MRLRSLNSRSYLARFIAIIGTGGSLIAPAGVPAKKGQDSLLWSQDIPTGILFAIPHAARLGDSNKTNALVPFRRPPLAVARRSGSDADCVVDCTHSIRLRTSIDINNFHSKLAMVGTPAGVLTALYLIPARAPGIPTGVFVASPTSMGKLALPVASFPWPG